MDGLCATSLIRKFDLKTPIISMTSNFQPVDVLKYIDIGMNDCLPKPFTKEGMIIMLQKYLSNPWPDRNLITQGNESGSVSINLKRRSPPSSSTPPGSPQRSQLPSHQGLSSSITSSMTYLPDINRNMRRPGYSEEHVDLNNNNNNNNNNNPPLSDHRDQLDPSRFNFNLLDHFQDHNQAHNDTSSAEQHSQKRFKVWHPVYLLFVCLFLPLLPASLFSIFWGGGGGGRCTLPIFYPFLPSFVYVDLCPRTLDINPGGYYFLTYLTCTFSLTIQIHILLKPEKQKKMLAAQMGFFVCTAVSSFLNPYTHISYLELNR